MGFGNRKRKRMNMRIMYSSFLVSEDSADSGMCS